MDMHTALCIKVPQIQCTTLWICLFINVPIVHQNNLSGLSILQKAMLRMQKLTERPGFLMNKSVLFLQISE